MATSPTGNHKPHMPSDVTPDLGFFDRFATTVNQLVSRPAFFVACVSLVVVWLPSFLLLQDVDTWQLIINTITTIVTFLLVALLQNTQTRSDRATQDKLNALAEGLADVMEHLADHHDSARLAAAVTELRDAIGLEDRESA